jgi:hypothetical protein
VRWLCFSLACFGRWGWILLSRFTVSRLRTPQYSSIAVG